MFKPFILFLFALVLAGCSIESSAFSATREAMNESVLFIEDNTIMKTAAPNPKFFDAQTTPSEGLNVTDYLLPPENSRIRTNTASYVMIHYMSNAANKPNAPYQLDDMYSLFESYGVSAHYVIDRNGDIFQFVSEDRVAFHAGAGGLALFPEYEDRLNDYSIGIELLAIGTKEEMLFNMKAEEYDKIDSSLIGYTEAQYDSLNKLLEDIYDRHPAIRRNRLQIVGHDEYAPMRKADPGSLFDWGKIGF